MIFLVFLIIFITQFSLAVLLHLFTNWSWYFYHIYWPIGLDILTASIEQLVLIFLLHLLTNWSRNLYCIYLPIGLVKRFHVMFVFGIWVGGIWLFSLNKYPADVLTSTNQWSIFNKISKFIINKNYSLLWIFWNKIIDIKLIVILNILSSINWHKEGENQNYIGPLKHWWIYSTVRNIKNDLILTNYHFTVVMGQIITFRLMILY